MVRLCSRPAGCERAEIAYSTAVPRATLITLGCLTSRLGDQRSGIDAICGRGDQLIDFKCLGKWSHVLR